MVSFPRVAILLSLVGAASGARADGAGKAGEADFASAGRKQTDKLRLKAPMDGFTFSNFLTGRNAHHGPKKGILVRGGKHGEDNLASVGCQQTDNLWNKTPMDGIRRSIGHNVHQRPKTGVLTHGGKMGEKGVAKHVRFEKKPKAFRHISTLNEDFLKPFRLGNSLPFHYKALSKHKKWSALVDGIEETRAEIAKIAKLQGRKD